MKKIIFIVAFLINGTIVLNAQDKLEEAGFYDNKIKIIENKIGEKTVVSFPMKHAGTQKFYNDIRNKIDSLKNQGYYFLFEQVQVDGKDELVRKKLKKITGNITLSGEKGYVKLLKEYGVIMKEELIDQPSYNDLGLDSLTSRRLDVSGADIVNYFEQTYGEIKLNKCEIETPVLAKDTCKGKVLKKKNTADAIVSYRDKMIAEGIIKENHTKVALLYGEGHLPGILSLLKNN